MPIYEYTCKTCGNDFERLLPMSSMNEPMPCPRCEGESIRRLSVFTAFSSTANGEPRAVAGAGGGCCGGGGACACAAAF